MKTLCGILVWMCGWLLIASWALIEPRWLGWVAYGVSAVLIGFPAAWFWLEQLTGKR